MTLFDRWGRPVATERVRRALGFREGYVLDSDEELHGLHAYGQIPSPAPMNEGWEQHDPPVAI